MSATGEAAARDGQGGYTLAEALVAVAITAMISGLMFPMLNRGFAGAAFQQAVSGMRADLRMMRAQAIRSGREVDLEVADEGLGYGWKPGPQRRLIAGMRLQPQGLAVRFYADGSSSGGELGLSQGRYRAQFAVDPDTGIFRSAS